MTNLTYDIDDVSLMADELVEAVLAKNRGGRISPNSLEDKQDLRMALFPLVANYLMDDTISSTIAMRGKIFQRSVNEMSDVYVEQQFQTYHDFVEQQINQAITPKTLIMLKSYLVLDGSKDDNQLVDAIRNTFLGHAMQSNYFNCDLGKKIAHQDISNNNEFLRNHANELMAPVFKSMQAPIYSSQVKIIIDQSMRYLQHMQKHMTGHTPTNTVEISMDTSSVDVETQPINERRTFRQTP